MYISNVRIRNYKNFYKESIPFQKTITTVIGENGTGKTNLFNAIRARCLGKEADSDLMSKLNNLKSRIYDAGSEQNDFNKKFNELYRMASGQIRNVTNASVAA